MSFGKFARGNNLTSIQIDSLDVDHIRERIVDWAIIITAIIGPIGVVISLLRGLEFGWVSLSIIHTSLWIAVCFVAFYRRRIPFKIKSYMLLFAIFIMALGGLVTFGFTSHGSSFLLLCVVLATALLGVRFGIATIIGGLIFLVSLGILVILDIHRFSLDFNVYSKSAPCWLTIFWVFAVQSAILVGCLGFLHNSMFAAIKSHSESESNFRAIFNGVNDAIFIHDRRTGEVLDVNDRMCSMFGYSKKQFLELEVEDVSADGAQYSQKQAFELIKKAVNDGPQTVEWRSKDKQGNLFWTGVSLTAAVLNGRKVVLGVARDISEKKAAEEALQKSEAKFKALSEASFEGILLSEDNVCVGQNLAAKNMFGYSDEEVLGKDGKVWLKPKLEDISPTDIFSQFTGPCETTCLRKDGSTFPCEIRGKTIIYADREVRVTSLRDITRRKSVEDALKESERNYRNLIETLGESFGIQDENGVITYVNKKQFELLGYTKEEMIGKHFIDFMDEQSRAKANEQFADRTKGGAGSYEVSLIRKDGSLVDVIISGRPMFDNQGNFKGSFGVATDITERKKMEKALKESENRLALAMEGAALGMWDWDLTSGEAVWTDRNLTMLGYGATELKQNLKTWKGIIHPDDWPEVSDKLNSHLQGNTDYFQVEYRSINSLGHWQWVQARGKVVEYDEHGAPLRMAGIVVDIDERKKTELELEKTRALLTAAIEQSHAGIVIADAPDVRIRIANSAALGIRGESSEALTDIPVDLHPGKWSTYNLNGSLCKPENLPLSKAVLFGETTRNQEVIIQRSDGEKRTVLANASPVRDSSGNVIAGVVVFPDITDRINAEKALRESERRLRMVLEHMPELLMAFDRDKNLIVANEACERIIGYSRQELLGNYNQEDINFTDSPDSTINEAIKTLEGDYINQELTFINKDGQEKTISWSNISNEVPIPGWTSWAIGVDVTEIRRAEKALKESEARYRSLFSNMREGVALHKILYSEEGIPEDYIVTDVNHAYEDITGFTRDHAIGRRASELYGTGEPPFLAEYAEVCENDTHWKFDTYWAPMDKHLSISSFSPEPAAFATVFTDVTDQKKTEKTLAETMTHLNSLLDNMPDPVHFKDKHRRHVYINKALEEFIGISKEEIIGKTIGEISPGNLDYYSSKTDHQIIEDQQLIRFEHEAKNSNGIVRLLDTVKFPIKNEQGKFIGIGGLSRDITEARKLERQLVQSQKMEAIGTLAGGIAHDFNNLLQIIQGFADVAIFKLDSGRSLTKELDEIKKASKTAAELTRGLLTFSRRLESKLAPVNLNREFENVVNILKRTMPKSIEIVFKPIEAVHVVKADPAQIQQVVMNLGVNAKDAMPEGGRLTIEIENVELDAEYCQVHLGTEPGAYVLVTVSDTGAGMDPDVAKHIFDPFFTTKDPGQGTGLGLSIAYGIIKNHGGHILCYSEIGHGATFKIYLPAAPEELETFTEKDPHDLPRGSETILLVDDEESILSSTAAILANYGYKTIIADRGQEALEIFRERHKEISVILLDLIMPNMDGRVCLEEILKIDPMANVIIASGYAADGIMEEVMEIGAKASLRKPFETARMLELIRAVIDDDELPEAEL